MAISAQSTSAAPSMGIGLRINLSVMMFLQFAIWGAWFTVLGNYLTQLGFSGDSIGSIYGTMALGTIVAPLIVGQIADRFFPSQWLMALLHLAGAACLYWLARITPAAMQAKGIAGIDAVESATNMFYYVALLYALIYSPTLALSNTIAFTHVPDGTRDFPRIRVFGTIGWIAAGMIVGKLLPMPEIADRLSEWLQLPVEKFFDPKKTEVPILLAAGFSALLGIWSLFLPHTPPKGRAGDVLPFLKAVSLLKEPSFAVFFGVSFIITIVLAFYYNFTGVWLEKKIGVTDVASTMTIGQWSEMLLLPFLPVFLRIFGMKWVLVIGMAAWGIRYYLFAIASPEWSAVQVPWYEREQGFLMTPINPVLLTLALHGICYDFFFAAAFIHVDNESPADIRGSAQALFTFLTYGVGMWLGSVFSGKLMFAVSHELSSEPGWKGFFKMIFTKIKVDDPDLILKATDWYTFWMVPSVGVLASMAIFVVFFRLHSKRNKTV